MANLKLVATSVLVVGLASAGAFALAASRARDRDPKPAADAPAPAPAAKPRAALKDEPQQRVSGQIITVRGRVVDPNGRPVAGATLRAFDRSRDDSPAPAASTGADGRFVMQVPESRWRPALRERNAARYPWLIATAQGFGPGWASAVREPGAADELTIRLVEEGPPIEGLIVGLEGRPVAEAQIKLRAVWLARDGKSVGLAQRAQEHGLDGPWVGLDSLPAAITMTTGSDGRFRMTGIGRDRIADLIISGPTIATIQLYVLDGDGPALTTTSAIVMGTPDRSRTTYHSRKFEYVAAPPSRSKASSGTRTPAGPSLVSSSTPSLSRRTTGPWGSKPPRTPRDTIA